MNEKDIQSIVSTVLAQLGEDVKLGSVTAIAPIHTSANTSAGISSPYSSAASTASTDVDTGELPDLGSETFRKWYGIQGSENDAINQDLLSQTTARVNKGRAGPRLRTTALLCFLADHSRAKDTVIKNVDSAWLKERNLLEVQSLVKDKDEYLTRPDLGRRLNDEAKSLIQQHCKASPQVQVVLSDGLSLDAVTHNHDQILPALLSGLQSAGLDVGTPFFLRYGRVKAQDEIARLLNAEVNVLLIGERPGLGQSESLSCYAIYRPTVESVESDRTVISNIHNGGTPPVEAAAVIVDLVKQMLAQKASGTKLKR